MQTEQPWYIGFRAKALSAVYLTRRDDLIVSEQPDNGLDLLVTILKNNNLTGRIFGANVQATMSNSDIIQNNDVFHIKSNEDQIKHFQEFPFPVCLIFFTLDNENGYYKWILEPVVEQDKNQELSEKSKILRFNTSNEFKRLTNDEIDNIFNLVNTWYDNQSLAQQNHSSKSESKNHESDEEIDNIVTKLENYHNNRSQKQRKRSSKTGIVTISSKYKEVEAVLVSHPAVAEAAVIVGKPDKLKDEKIVAFVILKENYQPSEDLKNELKQHIVKEIGDFTCPDEIHFREFLLKTPSGEINHLVLQQMLAPGKEISGDILF